MKDEKREERSEREAREKRGGIRRRLVIINNPIM
jgi:hypothetical protein